MEKVLAMKEGKPVVLETKVVDLCWFAADVDRMHVSETRVYGDFGRTVCGLAGPLLAVAMTSGGMCRKCEAWLSEWKVESRHQHHLHLSREAAGIPFRGEWNWVSEDVTGLLWDGKRCPEEPSLHSLPEHLVVYAMYHVVARRGKKIHLSLMTGGEDRELVCGRVGSTVKAVFGWDDLCLDCYNWLEHESWVVNCVEDDRLELGRNALQPYSPHLHRPYSKKRGGPEYYHPVLIPNGRWSFDAYG